MTDMMARIASLDPEKREILLRKLRERTNQTGRTEICGRPRDGRDFILTYAQLRLWFLQQLESGSAHYNIPESVALNGPVEVGVLERSLREIVKRHETLRTRFREEHGEPRQIIEESVSFKIPLIDLTGLSELVGEEETGRLVDENARQPFKLEEAPLFRASVVREKEKKHVLIMSMNHIISDGWSMQLLKKELGEFYEAIREGRRPKLKELPIQYADYAEWQRGWLEGEELNRNLKYWKEELKGAPEVIDLPLDRGRGARQSHRGSAVVFKIDERKAEGLRRLSRQEGGTLFMTLLAGFQILLYRYSGQEDICIGTPVANRNKTEVEELIGCFVNTLIFRGRLGGNPTVEEVIARARETAIGAYDHQEMPFERIVEELRPARSLSHNPLFQVMFALQNLPSQKIQMEGVNLSEVAARLTPTQFDLNATMIEEAGGGIVSILQYDRELFDEERIERMKGHFERLLEDVIVDAKKRIREAELLREEERQQVLIEWNDTEERKERLSLTEAIEGQVKTGCERIAAGCGEEEVSYGELWRRAGCVTRRLEKEGIGEETVVGLVMERGIEYLILMIGIIRAGGAYLPLDPKHPMKRNKKMIADSEAKYIVAEERYAIEMRDEGEPGEELPRILVAEELWKEVEENEERERRERSGRNLAYVIFTSGSTGVPKGAMVEERGMMNHLWGKVRDLELTEEDVIAQTASQVFDISVWQNLAAALVGGRVEIMKDEEAHDPRKLIKEAAEKGVTILETVPSMLREIVDQEKGDMKRLEKLRWMIATGEALDMELAREWVNVSGNIRLMNAYGPTECSDDVTHEIVEVAEESMVVTIGRPIRNTQIYLMDDWGGVLPVGIAGNICVAGEGVGRGYMREAGKSADVFVPDAFAINEGSVIYRTGDIGRYRGNGAIEYLGRRDGQVKIRGHRIELGEIEAALKEMSELKQAAVIAIEHGGREKRLVAYIVKRNAAEISSGEVRNYLKGRLPDYMAPDIIIEIDELPLNVNGKIDRAALSSIEGRESDEEVRGGLPRTPTEEVLVSIWSEVLGLANVGTDQNFFDLGGHSLMATRVLSRVRETFKVDLPLRLLFESPTIQAMGRGIDEEKMHSTGAKLPLLTRAPRDVRVPASFVQEARVRRERALKQQGEPLFRASNMYFLLHLSGQLNSKALEITIREIVRRHEILRTTFHIVDDQVVQFVSSGLFEGIPTVDLQSVAEREAESLRLLTEMKERRFDLNDGPLIDVRLMKFREDEHIFAFIIDHIICDGWSIGVLAGELVILYNAICANSPSPLSDLSLQYADYAYWQRQWLRDEILESRLSYWIQKLGDEDPHPKLELPMAKCHLVENYQGASKAIAMPPELYSKLRALSRKQSATLFVVLLAAFKALLHRYTGKEKIGVLSPSANRSLVETEAMVGWFAQNQVIRTSLTGDPTFSELAARVRETVIEAFVNELPLQLIYDAVRAARETKITKLARQPYVFFNLQKAEANVAGAPQQSLSGLAVRPVSTGSKTSSPGIAVNIAEISDQLLVNLEYETDRFDDISIERILDDYKRVLECVALNPEMNLSQLPL